MNVGLEVFRLYSLCLEFSMAKGRNTLHDFCSIFPPICSLVKSIVAELTDYTENRVYGHRLGFVLASDYDSIQSEDIKTCLIF